MEVDMHSQKPGFKTLSLVQFVILSSLVIGLSACSDASKKKLNHAAALGWREYVQTDLDMSEFYNSNFTLAARFMLQYPKAYVGPILATSGDGLEISKQDDAGTLVARFGNTSATYTSVNLQAGQWYHLALVRDNNALKLYLDGQPICPAGVASCEVGVDSLSPSGTLRLGRPGSSPISGSAESQYYGFIDDVAIFKTALSQNAIQSLINTPRLSGSEANLFAGWTFDNGTPSGADLPQKLARPVEYRRITATGTVASQYPLTALVSQTRDSAADLKFMKFPNNQVALTLPFPKGEAWKVSQGWQGSISHHGRAAFAWDFVLAGKPVADTKGKPFYAAAGGPVIELRTDRDSCSGWPANHIDVEHAPDEIGVYLHFIKNKASVGLNQNVVTGTKLAETGDTGNTGCGNYHLHFALHNMTESHAGNLVTIPATFENYEASTDNGAHWSKVVKGIPKQDEWVRNPN